MTDRLQRIVSQVLASHSVRGRRVAVGLSGGIDSVVLLDLVCGLRESHELTLSAVHVNHQISAHSSAWEAFCQSLCADQGVALEVRRVVVPRDGSGVEAAARLLRYRAYSSLDTDFVALGHQLDDQAETFLLQLLRGAGPKGLAAMPMLREAKGGRGKGKDESKAEGGRRKDEGIAEAFDLPSSLILPPSSLLLHPSILRPLLHVPRRDVEAYAKARGLKWVEDESNADSRYDRNFLRNELLPLLETRFPGYRETLARASRNLADYAILAEELAELDAKWLRDGAIPVEALRQVSDPRALNLLRSLFAVRGLPMPQRERLIEALRQCREAGADSEMHVSFGTHGLRLYRGVVELVVERAEFPADWHAQWDGRRPLSLPDGLGILRAQDVVGKGIAVRHFVEHDATVRGRSGSERMRPAENRPTRSLRNLFQESAVPPWERNRMPLLFFGDKLAWVPGIGVAAEFRAAGAEPGIDPEWERR